MSVRKPTTLTLPVPLPLDSGQALDAAQIAYESYGELAADKSNAILVCHALTGDQYLASTHPVTGKPGWWDRMVGPGKPIDTARYFVICANVIGSCLGSTGPASPAADGKPYAMRFPVITIRDMVRGLVGLLDGLGIERLHAVVGGSMGGMQALSLAANFPGRTERVLAIATTARHSAQNIAFHEVGRQAIMADPAWAGGDYYASSKQPDAGLAVARMAAHITYLSEEGLTEKFGRRLQDRPDGSAGEKSFGFDADFQVESYLRYQGSGFTRRFDANSYLYITRAMDYFDLAEEFAGEQGGGQLAAAFAGSSARFCLVSFDTDWLYPTAESRHIVHALNAAGAPVSFVELSAPYGHDSFLLDVPPLDRVVRGFLGG
ncbi:Homoserine O-acetyltransferase [Alteripontixanthobacter maritimus]|uniref:Homoserine O-acetyltransferase n=1 Tax=Alteripontixanthobacter maritimus TaxID=2161824 RepID=A0A369QGB7_9SPHN|nr:homoserine O-acetyltransferase [Alteripontixanthobacter maritimus]RDC58886.1 Homoserine O-acetyltransferase [Alteripontixanthobacter maritimus]RDC61338.1 Homoserine O-acetyltransferase [Alteripontixanthobacter maritimus]